MTITLSTASSGPTITASRRTTSPNTGRREPRLVVRPLHHGETRPILAVFEQLSARSVYHRFHSGMPTLTASVLRRLATRSPGRCEAFVAELDGRPVGVARWCRYPTEPAAADLSVEVADSLHRSGIGTLLLRAVVESASVAGVATLRAYVHPENATVHRWLRMAGATPPGDEDDDYRLPIERARAMAVVRCPEPIASLGG